MPDVFFRRLAALNEAEMQPLIASSIGEGFPFVATLCDEFATFRQRFDGPGGLLLGGYRQAILIAVGGVHADPYLARPDIGRIRHVYVMPALRRAGVGRALVQALLVHARLYFRVVTLRTLTHEADIFYCSLGFSTEPRFDHATHWLSLSVSD